MNSEGAKIFCQDTFRHQERRIMNIFRMKQRMRFLGLVLFMPALLMLGREVYYLDFNIKVPLVQFWAAINVISKYYSSVIAFILVNSSPTSPKRHSPPIFAFIYPWDTNREIFPLWTFYGCQGIQLQKALCRAPD